MKEPYSRAMYKRPSLFDILSYAVVRSPFTRMLMPEADDALLEHLFDDGSQIEPVTYVPIVPTILLNGAEGIATGFFFFGPSPTSPLYSQFFRLMLRTLPPVFFFGLLVWNIGLT